jgi:hypothetical protein
LKIGQLCVARTTHHGDGQQQEQIRRPLVLSTEGQIVGQKFEANEELDRAFTGEMS